MTGCLTIRWLWPPLKAIPLLPIWVWSPWGNWHRSSSNAQLRTTDEYHRKSYALDPQMLCCTVPFTCHAVWSHKAIRKDVNCNVPPITGSSPRIALSRVDLPHPTGPTTMVIFPRGTIVLMSCRIPDGLSLHHPKSPFSITTAWEPNGFISHNSTEKRSFCEISEFLSDSVSILMLEVILP